MAHKVEGTWSLAYWPADQRDSVADKLQESGVDLVRSEDGMHATVIGTSEDFDVARAIYQRERAELKRQQESGATGESDGGRAAGSFEHPTDGGQYDRAVERAEAAKNRRQGTLMENPPEMREGRLANLGEAREMSSEEQTMRFGENRETNSQQLPGNSPPPGLEPVEAEEFRQGAANVEVAQSPVPYTADDQQVPGNPGYSADAQVPEGVQPPHPHQFQPGGGQNYVDPQTGQIVAPSVPGQPGQPQYAEGGQQPQQ